MPSARPQRIALLIDTSVTFSSLVIQGVARYAREQPHWQLLLQPRGSANIVGCRHIGTLTA